MRDEITQALVLIGGKASRLRKDGIAVTGTKAFLHFQGRPLLYWTLCALHRAGITKLVISGDTVHILHKASRIIRALPCVFNRVDYFRDEGLGVHGVPYELRYLLDNEFIFECGHSFSTPNHYRQLCRRKTSGGVVFSAYVPHPDNLRQPVTLRANMAYYNPASGRHAVAHPIAADIAYAKNLANLGFSIDSILLHLSTTQQLMCVLNTTAPEFDTKAEMISVFEQYNEIVAEFATI